MPMPDEETLETVKYYTRARKFPQLLGRFPDGTKIPGGPYTVHQLLAGIGIIAFGSMTMGIWGVMGGLGNVLVLFGVAFAAMFIIGRLPMNGRNPFFALIGFYKASVSPRSGRFQGRSIRIRRPRTVTNKTVVWRGPLPEIGPKPLSAEVHLERVHHEPAIKTRRLAPSSPAGTAPALTRTSTAPLTGVQALLARADSADQEEKAVH